MWPFKQSEKSIAREKRIAEMIEKDATEQAANKQRRKEIFARLAECRKKYPLGAVFLHLGVRMSINEIYLNNPNSDAIKASATYFSEKQGYFAETSLPIEAIEKALD